MDPGPRGIDHARSRRGAEQCTRLDPGTGLPGSSRIGWQVFKPGRSGLVPERIRILRCPLVCGAEPRVVGASKR
ncbi:MAG: hypothetical protein CMJ67_05370 [Planctomycetaceae bacterium]|nr:hypothetical protein [Planctomycetaceae bacterium]